MTPAKFSTTLASLLLLYSALSFGQDKSMRDTLGTRLTATPETIVLDWDPKHPWNADITHGASLMAEYDTKNEGVVLQQLSQGKSRAGSTSSMQFILPETLTVEPIGPVCLFVRLSNNKVLPIRKPDANHSDTSRFRDQPWEAATAVHTGIVQQKRFNSELQAAADNADRQVEFARQNLIKIGWSEATGCSNIITPSFTSATKPNDVLPLSEQPDAARQVCVTRVLLAEAALASNIKAKDTDGMLTDLLKFVLSPDLSSYLLNTLKKTDTSPDASLRQRQLAEFQKDWARFSKNPDDLQHPLLGDARDKISLQELTTQAGKTILPLMVAWLTDKPASSVTDKIDPEEVAGFAGGELEAYSRCVIDSQKQLRSKLEQWETNQADAPRLREMAHKELTASCEKNAASLGPLIAQQKAAHDRLAAEQHQGASKSSTESVASQSTRNLNSITCSVQH
jgi:hypothetical protein